jgi:hypothetical protein
MVAQAPRKWLPGLGKASKRAAAERLHPADTDCPLNVEAISGKAPYPT